MFPEFRPITAARTLVAAAAVALTLLAAPAALAATADTATAEASPGPYLVDTPITFTSTTPCTTACRLTWTFLNGTRLGDLIGEGERVSTAFATPGLKTVQLRLTETCVGTTRLPCASFAYVSVFVQAAPTPEDTTPPTFTASGLTAEATGPSTVVDYTFDATDPDDAVVSKSCTPAPGSSFPVGSTPIDCTATDSHGVVGHETFDVVVSDTTAPSLRVPDPITAEATSSAGAAVTYAAIADDLVDGALTPMCSTPSGATFSFGPTTVDCTVTDAHDNSSSASFVVDVVDTTAPALKVPDPITAEATSPAGAAVTYTVSASDAVDATLTPSCSTASGATFPLGSTTVDCSVTDGHGNSSSRSFVVDVVDTTAPTLTVPGPLAVNATSPTGAVVTYAAAANDLVDGSVASVCTPASGTVFPIGTKTVSCTATDLRGNLSAAKTFDVHVKGGREQLVDVLQQVNSWNLQSNTLSTRLQSVIKALDRGTTQGCRALADLVHDLGGHLGKRLTAAQLQWVGGELARISNVLGC